MKTIWRTRLEVVDIDTGEVITKSHVERNEYYIKKKEIKNEKYGNFNGTTETINRTIIWLCRSTGQTRLF